MPNAISQFLHGSRGAAMLEYSLVMAAIALGLISAIVMLGETLGAIFQTVISAAASMNAAAFD